MARAGLNHLSFEVHDIDDVFTGHEYLRRNGAYEHMWGLGRHLLGSQVYDFWADPNRLHVSNGGNLVSADEGVQSQWGDLPLEKFISHASP